MDRQGSERKVRCLSERRLMHSATLCSSGSFFICNSKLCRSDSFTITLRGCPEASPHMPPTCAPFIPPVVHTSEILSAHCFHDLPPCGCFSFTAPTQSRDAGRKHFIDLCDTQIKKSCWSQDGEELVTVRVNPAVEDDMGQLYRFIKKSLLQRPWFKSISLTSEWNSSQWLILDNCCSKVERYIFKQYIYTDKWHEGCL